jgi:predicted CopG family antitoxin
MSFTTVSIRLDVAKKLKAAKAAGESYSDTLARLLENQPSKSVREWLKSLEPLEGRGIFTAASRKRLKADQRTPRPSARRRRASA